MICFYNIYSAAEFASKAVASIFSHFTKSWYQPYNTKKINKKE